MPDPMTNIYAIRVDEDRIVAAEVNDVVAAMLFDQGRTLLLATEAELAAYARREKRLLTILRCDQAHRGPRTNSGWVSAHPVTPAAARETGDARSSANPAGFTQAAKRVA
jgi:hypothetical protein